MIKKLIEPNTKWRHKLGAIYTVLMTANTNAMGSKRIMYKPMVVYQGKNGHVWAKTVKDFLGTMEPVVEESK